MGFFHSTPAALKKYIVILLCAALLCGAGFFFFGYFAEADAAVDIVARCKGTTGGELCYEREIPKLFPQQSIKEVFEVIRQVRRLDPSYQFCHVAAHKLGELVVAEDPQNWLGAIPLNPSDGLCSNGFIHGVIVGRFRNDTLDAATLEKTIPDFARACEPRADWQPSGLDQAICYHGMGHLFMFITEADIRKSLEVCARISNSPTGNFMRVCREGVFMQIYQPLEPDDYALIDLLPEKPTKENYRRLCAAYQNDEDEGACLREAWPMFRTEILTGDVASFCAAQPNEAETNNCWETGTTIIGRQLLGESDKAAAACEAVPSEYQTLCFTVVAQAIIEEDRARGEEALAVCARASERIADSCIARLASRARWIYGEKRDDFCALVPSQHRVTCER